MRTGNESGEEWRDQGDDLRSPAGDERHHAEAHALRQEAERERAGGDAIAAEKKDSLADVEDALAEYDERLTGLESSWLTGGWKSGIGWETGDAIRSETRAIEAVVVKTGEDPREFDKWNHSADLEVERQLRKARARLVQFQKLLWRAEILGALGGEIRNAQEQGAAPPDRATGFDQTAGSLDYRDAMLRRFQELQRGAP